MAARGRVVVGLPLSGTLAGTVGTAFTDIEDKSTVLAHAGTAVADHSAHTHSVTTNVTVANHAFTQPTVAWPAGVPTAANESAHTHTYTQVVNHTHGLAFARGATTGTQTTTQGFTTATDTSSTKISDVTDNPGGGVATGTTDAGSAHTHTMSWPVGVPTNSGGAVDAHGVTNNAVTSGNPSATLTHAVTQPSNHTVLSSNVLAYIQYRACSKD